MPSRDEPHPQTRNPRWYDYVALPTMFLVCLMIPIGAIFLESTRPISPCALVEDPKITHVRIYHDGELMGTQSWNEPIINITIHLKSHLELWYFKKYLFGYSNVQNPSKLSLKYTTDADYKNHDNWEFITNENGDPVNPAKASDIKGSDEVMGFFYDLTLYEESSYIENWGNNTSIYLAMVEKDG